MTPHTESHLSVLVACYDSRISKKKRADLANDILALFFLATLYLSEQELTSMALHKQIRFVNIRLDDGQKKKYRSWVTTEHEHIAEYLGSMAQEQNRISLSYDENNDTYICSITCNNPTSPNFGCCLSSRHSDIWEAACIAVYKHVIMLGPTPWEEFAQGESWG